MSSNGKTVRVSLPQGSTVPQPVRKPLTKQGHCEKERKRRRFSVAFGRALSVRSKHLGRRLTRREWVALRTAVKAQCSKRVTPLARTVNRLIGVVGRLEQDLSTFKRPSKSFEQIDLMISIFRQDLMSLIDEETTLSEGCSHVAKKTKVILSAPERVFTTIPGHGVMDVSLPTSSQTVCCDRCQTRRSDFFFEKTGQVLSFSEGSDVISLEGLSPLGLRTLRSVEPLSLQGVWSSALDLIFSRR
jgi:hypothetical protein